LSDFACVATDGQQILSIGVVLVDRQHLTRQCHRGQLITAINRRHGSIKQLIHRKGATIALLPGGAFAHANIVSVEGRPAH
jgi:hypothetical protein